jgi:signal transduction histidine kinase
MNREAVAHLSTSRMMFDHLTTVVRSLTLSLAPPLRTFLIALLVAASYYAGSQIGFFFTPAGQPIATFWPPNAILLAVFLLTSPRLWWAFVLAVLPAHLLIQFQVGVPVLSSLGWFVGNTGEALLGAACIHFFKKETSLFDSVKGVVIFLAFGVGLATLVTSFLDAGSTLLTGLGRNYWMLWTTRLTSNMVANLTIVPPLLILGAGHVSRFRKVKPSVYFEAAALAVGIVVVSVLAFGVDNSPGTIPALIYAPLPLLIWAAMRFGPGGVSASVLVATLISAWNAIHGRGPFGIPSLPSHALSLNVLLTAFALPLMVMAALAAERRSIAERLRATRKNLVFARNQDLLRIARSLHGEVVQGLTLVGLSVDNLRVECSISAKAALDRVYDQISGVSELTRSLSHDLHPFALEYLGLSRALKKLCRETSEHSGIAIHFSERNVPAHLPSDLSLCLFRVAQGALSEIVQNSRAEAITAELRATEKHVLLRIATEEVRVSSPQWERTQLIWMREAVASLGGTLQFSSGSSEGTIVEASLPLQSAH